MHKRGGEEEEEEKVKNGEKMTGMQRSLLCAPTALMWAEDKVRLKIGMPGAQWEKNA